MPKSKYVFLLLITIVLSLIVNEVCFANNVFQYNNTERTYQLVIYGGEPEGVSAAITAARKGINTLLVLKREKPGGLMTYGGLNFLDINHGPDGKNINKGFFAEWHENVGGKTTFSISKAVETFQNMLEKEKNIEIIKSTNLISVTKNAEEIVSIIIETDKGIQEIGAMYFIDASQDADLAVMGGTPFFKGGGDIGLPERHMAATLVLHIGNVNWQELAVDAKENKFGPSFINQDNAWGFVEIGHLYKPVDKNTKLRGLNIVIEEKGSECEVYINALLVFDFNPMDAVSLKKAYQRAEKEAEHVLEFLKVNLSGFENAKLLSFPEELYIRESRHIVSKYQLKVADLLYSRIPEDTIALASYPLDYQASTPGYNGFVLFNPKIYGIPLRSLQPINLNNLFVVGRSAGYSSLAAASARVLPTGMSSGEAAGLVVSYLIKDSLKINELIDKDENINKDFFSKIRLELRIDEELKKYNKYINRNLISTINDQETIKHIEYLLSWGLIMGGYQNNFRFKDTITEREFAHIIIKGLKQQSAPILYEWIPGGLEAVSNNIPLTRDQAAMLLIVAVSKPISVIEQDEYFAKAFEYGLIPDIIVRNIKENRVLNRTEAYILISSFLQKYQITEEIRFYRGE